MPLLVGVESLHDEAYGVLDIQEKTDCSPISFFLRSAFTSQMDLVTFVRSRFFHGT